MVIRNQALIPNIQRFEDSILKNIVKEDVNRKSHYSKKITYKKYMFENTFFEINLKAIKIFFFILSYKLFKDAHTKIYIFSFI